MLFDFFSAPISRQYDPKLRMSAFEKFSQARVARDELVALLEDEDNGAGNALECCRKSMRCRSAACAVCTRRFRRWYGSVVAAVVSKSWGGWTSCSLVPDQLAFKQGQLNQFDVSLFKDRLRKQLSRNSHLAGCRAIGAFDFAFESKYWRPHLYLLIEVASPEVVANALRRLYPPGIATSRPVHCVPVKRSVDDAIRVATYSFKSNFYERCATLDGRGNSDTFKKKLSRQCASELACCLHEWGFGGRLFRYGLTGGLAVLNAR